MCFCQAGCVNLKWVWSRQFWFDGIGEVDYCMDGERGAEQANSGKGNGKTECRDIAGASGEILGAVL